jgi:hypothetical protein
MAVLETLLKIVFGARFEGLGQLKHCGAPDFPTVVLFELRRRSPEGLLDTKITQRTLDAIAVASPDDAEVLAKWPVTLLGPTIIHVD